MTNFTNLQLEFIKHKALGYSNERAAVAAGYSEKGAKQQGSVLAQRTDIKAAIKKAKSGKPSKAEIAAAVQSNAPKTELKMLRDKYADPEQFLRDLMNNPSVPLLMRKDAAKDLMPYCHARVGEKGKKETAKDDAHAISKGKSPSKFRTQEPPSLPAGVADLSKRRAANG